LVRHAVTDLHIHSARVGLPGHRAPLYLHSSPEYAMKRLLAAGSGDIFQIAHVFRGNKPSPWHNPEFTLIEWYRCGYSMPQLMTEVAQLTQALLARSGEAPVESLRYSEAFERELRIDPLRADDAALRTLAIAHRLDRHVAEDCSRDQLLDWLMGSAVGPRLGTTGLCFVHHYPGSQAARARRTERAGNGRGAAVGTRRGAAGGLRFCGRLRSAADAAPWRLAHRAGAGVPARAGLRPAALRATLVLGA